jgi:HEPN domain-containing protein
MPPANGAPGTALEWLDRAKGKLALARQPLPQGAFWEDLCFLCQQAAELGIKSVYIVHGWIFPFVHNLSVLLDGLESQGLSIPPEVQFSDRLSVYAVQARYPGPIIPVTEAEFQESFRVAEAVLALAQSFQP